MQNGVNKESSVFNIGVLEGPFYLDIPPQSIQQKEVFANQISATRKGVIVESEGVVFRDIIIQGTTGIMPGKRGSNNNPQANFSSFSAATSGPESPKGVNSEGKSTDPNTNKLSGYEEFIRLRQFFLKYAHEKVEEDGNRFLIFINEKDNQTLIVEPMDFTMTRSSNSPLTYNYKIVLRGIADLSSAFKREEGGPDESGPLGYLEDAENISANIQAAIEQGRDIFNQNIQKLQRISQSVDDTVNGVLRQLQFASSDLKDGLSTVMSLPEVLARNAKRSDLARVENLNQIDSIEDLGNLDAASGTETNGVNSFSSATTPLKPKPGENLPQGVQDRQTIVLNFARTKELLNRLENDERIPVPREVFEETKNNLREISNGLADFTGLGSTEYNKIKGRVSTISPDPLKVVSDQEFILLGELTKTAESMNLALASNTVFQPDAEVAFENASQQFQNENIPVEQRISIRKPSSVKEITIRQNDTLEKIAQRELGDATRWVDLVVLNDLKPPYIDSQNGDGVKQTGDKLLVGVR